MSFRSIPLQGVAPLANARPAAGSLRSGFVLYAALGLIAVFAGLTVPILGFLAPILLATALITLFILKDFRVGIVLVVLLTPISATSVFPHEMLGLKGFNPLNVILAATLGSYLLKRVLRGAEYRLIPWRMMWLYVAPITLAAVLGSRHVGEIPVFLKVAGLINFDSALGYLRDLYIKPMLLILSAILVGAAIRESRRPERLLIPAFIAAWLLALLVLLLIALSGVSLATLASASARHFLSITGLHANELGMIFNMAYALLLFMLPATMGWVRALVLVSLAVLGIASVFTFSRAALGVFVFVNAAFFFSQRQIRALLVGGIGMWVVIAALPDAVVERATTGIAAENRQEVSAGRVDDIWLPLLPSVLKNPLIGSGLSSVMWSEPLRKGTMAPVGHTHSAYLGALLDFGVLGCGLIFAFFWYLWKGFRRLSREDVSPIFRGFFGGAAVCVVILLLQGISDDKFVPTNSQVLLWLAMGILIGRGGLLGPSGRMPAKV